jgi:two-component system OmpR family response regulator
MRLLVVEDEPDLSRTLEKALAEEGFAVDLAPNGAEALWKARTVQYDAIVLDLMIPAVDGWTVVERLRADGDKVPLLVLTARDAASDKVRALNAGADDYLTKPFTLAELVARIRALIRRSARAPNPVLTLGDVVIDTACRRVTRAGTDIGLTPKEYALLEFMAFRRGVLVTRSMLYEHVYGERDDSMSNVLDVYVSNIRRKIGRDLIRTRRGAGYLIDDSG